MSPGAAAGGAAIASRGAGIDRGRYGVVVGDVGIQAPLVNGVGHVKEAVSVGRRRADSIGTGKRAAKRSVPTASRVVPPGKDRPFDSAARGFFALCLGGKTDRKARFRGEPSAIAERLLEVDSDRGLIPGAEVGIVEERRGLISGREEEPEVVSVRHRRHRHLELRDPDAMNRLFVLPHPGAPHEELASGNEDALENGRLILHDPERHPFESAARTAPPQPVGRRRSGRAVRT